MASAKDLKKKIRSIGNTKKITRTMEMVATVRSKQAQDRVKATTPYSEKLGEILQSLAQAGSIDHPFLKELGEVKKSIVLVVTANRGLCGGYNANVLSLAEKWIAAEKAAGRAVETHVIGKKGAARFRFQKVEVARVHSGIGDKPTFKDAEGLAEEFMTKFLADEVQRVVIFATKYFSNAVQRAVEIQLLPIPRPEAPKDEPSAKTTSQIEFIFEPNRESILKALIPLSVKNSVYRILVEAVASEQIARRLAMKLATDNAEELIRLFTRRYNRQRQAGITQQIMEIVAGADALG
jgi:F-type H+-transporting ATPase subunit gamma